MILTAVSDSTSRWSSESDILQFSLYITPNWTDAFFLQPRRVLELSSIESRWTPKMSISSQSQIELTQCILGTLYATCVTRNLRAVKPSICSLIKRAAGSPGNGTRNLFTIQELCYIAAFWPFSRYDFNSTVIMGLPKSRDYHHTFEVMYRMHSIITRH